MAVTSWIRRQFKNGVVTTATSTMTAGATSFTVGAGTGATFPDGSVGPFIVTVDQGLATEEKILVASRSTDTFTVAASGRGYNGTTAQAHSGGIVLHTIDQQDLDEANQVASQTLGLIAASGDLLQGSAANTLVKLALGTAGKVLVAGASSASWSNSVQSLTVSSGGLTVTAGGITVTAGGVTVNAGGITVTGTTTLLSPTVAGPIQTNVLTAGNPSTGSTVPGRFFGSNNGSPTGATFAAGDFVTDPTNAKIWLCTVGGTPGTWVGIS